nr:hypothetical protein [Tanacetum cinerariifolium]
MIDDTKITNKIKTQLISRRVEIAELWSVEEEWKMMRARNQRDMGRDDERKEYGGGGGSPHLMWPRYESRHHTITARHNQKSTISS